MQGLHHHHNQLAALLTAALPKDGAAKTTAAAASTSEGDESSRITAIKSLHGAILYPPNSLLVSHSASFLAQGLSQLLCDELYSVRHAAAKAYGALCSALCSILIALNGRQNHVMLGTLVDQFIGWSLPSLRNLDERTLKLSLVSLHEFFNVGDGSAVERYALPVLKASQELLEDERTSMTLLPDLLGLLTLISLKFFRYFQPHFLDIVDLLLGWAMVPDILDPDKQVIMDSFLQFQKYWVNNTQFSLGLLSKFLGDMDMLLQDNNPGTPQQFKRLLTLLSCFCTVLRSVASGLLEINFLEQLSHPLSQMVPDLCRCLSMVGRKFEWSKWIEDCWRCLTLLAEILSERFSAFYSDALNLLFESLDNRKTHQVLDVPKVSSFHVHGVLKTNLQLLSLQKFGLIPSSVHNILHFDGPISQLRLHPNHLVTGSAAATYLFLLQHRKNDIVAETIGFLFQELKSLKYGLNEGSDGRIDLAKMITPGRYSQSELIMLIKFDLKVLLSCLARRGHDSFTRVADTEMYFSRVQRLVAFLFDNFDPFKFPVSSSLELQVTVLSTLERLTSSELTCKCSLRKTKIMSTVSQASSEKHVHAEIEKGLYSAIVFDHLKRYTALLTDALGVASPLEVKVEALKWLKNFCKNVGTLCRNFKAPFYPCHAVASSKNMQNLLCSILSAASDSEAEVRSFVATVVEMLLKMKLVHPVHFPVIVEVIMEKLGDSDEVVKDIFQKLLSAVLPVTMYTCGIYNHEAIKTYRPLFPALADRSTLQWKQVFALKQLPQKFQSQHLVNILSYISQRWSVPLSNWIQRLINSCHSRNKHSLTQLVEVDFVNSNGLWWDIKIEEDILQRISSANNFAGAWWAIHEAARFCISTRLRTNLGGPTQTFAALERMLLDISHVLRLESEKTDGNLITTSSYAHLLPMRFLLEFVEALKKNVYNAFEGSSILPPASRASSLFFRANKKVCDEWFSRISEPMMDAGLALQCHHATIHYCSLRLHDLSNLMGPMMTDKSKLMNENPLSLRERYSGDILRSMRHLALALVKNHDPEALVGLQTWANMAFAPLFTDENQDSSVTFNRYFSWITGLVYQAGGHHEKAAAHFMDLLQTEELLSFIGSDGVQFAIARIIESYAEISDWESLESWLLELQTIRAKHAGKSFSGALTTAGIEMNAVQALSRFDEGDSHAAWSYLDLTPKSSNEFTLEPRLALQRSEQMLLQAILLHKEGKSEKVPHELQQSKLMLGETCTVLPLDGLMEAAPYINQLYCISTFEEVCRLGENHDKVELLLSTYIETRQFPFHQVHQDSSLWLKVLRIYRNTIPTSSVTLELCKNLVILARKQGNLMLAGRLNTYLKDHSSRCSNENLREYFASWAEFENILLMRAENKLENAVKNLWSFVRPFILFSSSNEAGGSPSEVLKAKSCLKFSNWLQRDCLGSDLEVIIGNIIVDFNKSDISSPSEEVLTFSAFDDGNNYGVRHRRVIERLVGAARKSSTRLCPTMGKSWILYASWSFAQAAVSVSSSYEVDLQSSPSSRVSTEVKSDSLMLTETEQSRIKDVILPLTRNKSDGENLFEGPNNDILVTERTLNELESPLQQIVNVIESAAGAPGAEDYKGSASLSAEVSSQLHQCLVSSNKNLGDPEVLTMVADLVDIWWSLRRRRVSLYGLAAEAFMNCLSYSSLNHRDSHLSHRDVEPNSKYLSYNIRAMLYVLHILVNYGYELQDTFQSGLSKVPLLPWQEITPQLFARVSSHPDKVVRMQLENLLIMMAKLSPWSLVYPTLVDVNSTEKVPTEELQNILACLNRLFPRLVQDSELMIKELENITVLWEELWLGTLQDLHADVTRRINLLKEEAARIAANKTLSQDEKNKINSAKYSAMMAPVLVVLERRLTSTSRKPETPHELWFHDEYQEQIKSAVMKFKTPPGSVMALGDVWRPFEIIASSLVSHQRKSSVSFQEVAPQLASLACSNAPMPGLEKQIMIEESGSDSVSLHQDIVTVGSFSEQLTVLPTKTKPKKLVMVGSDGLKYTYLLKGREDLRLDARIMQLLQAIDGFLSTSSARRNHSLGIRYYSVTPISGRAGLIQWVNEVTSIYSIFKSRQIFQLQQLSELGTDAKSAVPPVPRPSDMFYGKIIPALKEKGIRRVISRRDWPHDVKRKVLLDLMKETPKELLHRELWFSSEGFKAFNSKLNRFSGSVAAMSIVGHILGLGDRHLDNILIDFCTGDVLHIDYNVCFDKGKRLKIPEIVPFRLTQTIEGALGLTGIEGSFRANCEAVLCSLKKNKDLILMLLEVFVWDPLTEWTSANFHDDAAVVGEERKGMELAVSLSLFASRVHEIRVPLQEHHNLLLSKLPEVQSALESFAGIMNQYEIVSSHFYHADQESSNIALHETSAKSFVVEATYNLERTHALLEIHAREFAEAKTAIMEKALEAATWIDQHRRVLDALRNSSFPQSEALLRLNGSGEVLSLTSAVLGVGVSIAVVPEPTQIQCREIDSEVSQLVSVLDHGLSSAGDALRMYSLALQHILPLDYLTTSPMHSWEQLLLSLNNLSSESISYAVEHGSGLIAGAHVDRLSYAKNNYNALFLQMTNSATEIERLEKECADLAISTSQQAESKTKERLLSAALEYIQHAHVNSGAQDTYQGTTVSTFDREIEERKENFFNNFSAALGSLFSDVKHELSKSLERFSGERVANKGRFLSDLESFFCEFEEQIDKCVLLTESFDHLKYHVSLNGNDIQAHGDGSSNASVESWGSLFKTIIVLCKNFVTNFSEVVVPSVMKSVVSYDSDVMDILGSILQIRRSVDTALEQLIQVELERVSLTELESSYFVNIGLITEQQLALKEAALKGRDKLSWEEAEELASQEESCRVRLDNLHSAWNLKDVRTSSLLKREANIYGTLNALERQFQSVITSEAEEHQHVSRGKALLASSIKPFSMLESMDRDFLSSVGSAPTSSSRITHLIDLVNSGNSLSELIWQLPVSMHNHAFFIWKICMLDLLLDFCTHDVAASSNRNLGFDELVDVVRQKVTGQLQEHISRYLKDRVAPIFLERLDQEIAILRQKTGSDPEFSICETLLDFKSTRKAQLMLEEFCNAYETIRAARSAAINMETQVNELKSALLKTTLEIVQIEWMYNIATRPFGNLRLILHKCLPEYDNLFHVISDIRRTELLENMRSSVAIIARSLEGLQSCEGASITAEGQLERAMSWACGVPSSSSVTSASAGNTGIPVEFHDHLMMRRKLLLEARERASDMMKVCISVLEFENSRDGFNGSLGEVSALKTGTDGVTWQQAFLSAIKKLDVAYHSFTRVETEWRLAQSNMKAASDDLTASTNELNAASAKAKAASGDFQSTLLAMRDSAYEASTALSAYAGVVRGHSTLTSECGFMLEEILAVTVDLPDIHALGNEASSLHSSLNADLSKANAVLIPLEALLSNDDAINGVVAKKEELRMEISLVHGQAIFRSYHNKVNEALQMVKPLVPPILLSIKGVYTLLTRLARAAGLHAGNLHKALEGLGESLQLNPQDIDPKGTEVAGASIDYNTQESSERFSASDVEDDGDSISLSEIGFSPDIGFLSPPDTIESGSQESDVTYGTKVEGSVDDINITSALLYSSEEKGDSLPHSSSGASEVSESSPGTVNLEFNQDMGTQLVPKNEASALTQDKSEQEREESKGGMSLTNVETANLARSGKNAYAVSVLRRVEMKLDGRDIPETREISISEQVDFLLRQATSIDNLCNMYEGWTPWI